MRRVARDLGRCGRRFFAFGLVLWMGAVVLAAWAWSLPWGGQGGGWVAHAVVGALGALAGWVGLAALVWARVSDIGWLAPVWAVCGFCGVWMVAIVILWWGGVGSVPAMGAVGAGALCLCWGVLVPGRSVVL